MFDILLSELEQPELKWLQSLSTREREWADAVQKMAGEPGVLLDLGGGSPYQGYISSEAVGSRTRYLCLDISFKARPHVVADVERLPLSSSSIDRVLCNAVLEHVQHPDSGIREMHRVLKPTGQAMVSVPFIYPYHDQIDYYRFTEAALKDLFKDFSQTKLVPLGDYFYATVFFLTGFRFALVRWVEPLLVALRLLVCLVLSLCVGLTQNAAKRNYLRSFVKSPIGWYIYCVK